jgi:hypothetical protein
MKKLMQTISVAILMALGLNKVAANLGTPLSQAAQPAEDYEITGSNGL